MPTAEIQQKRCRAVFGVVITMKEVDMCNYHIRMDKDTLVTDDDIKSCLNCNCRICCNPMQYCECGDRK